MKRPRIVIIGSCSTDMSVRLRRIPGPGEIVGEGVFANSQGGKGANQAVAAARAGGDVTLIACVGDDALGSGAINALAQEGVHVDHIHLSKLAPTGVALISVDYQGENSISLAPGANQYLSPAHIDSAESCISKADVVLVQLEIPYETAIYAIRTAKRLGVPVLFNPAPAREIPHPILALVDVVVVNRMEAAVLCGPGTHPTHGIDSIAETLEGKGIRKMVISMGSKGVYARKHGIAKTIPAFQVSAVDTTGAGDVLCGTLGLRIAQGKSFWESLSFAMAAASLSVTKYGAQASAPERLAIHNFMEMYNP